MITLKRASAEAVRYACMNFHYAKRVPSASYAYNVYNEQNEWCGVIIFGVGATPNIGKPFGMANGEVLELVRVALNGKQPCTSECVGQAIRQLHKDAPHIKMLVSFADIDYHHIGTIYQATNWIYLGDMNVGNRGFFIVHGKKMHPKTIHDHKWVQSVEWLKEHVDPKAEEVKTLGKRKYIFVFDKKLRKQWQLKSLPYPKKGMV